MTGRSAMDLGVVTDEVLLLLGRPDGAPSAWWTPWLARQEPEVVEEAVASAAALLAEQGVLGTDGAVTGPLGRAAEVVDAARAVCTVLVDGPGDLRVRCSLVVAPHGVLVDVQDPDEGGHRLAVVPAAEAVRWLAMLVDPRADAAGDTPPRRVDADELAAALPRSWHRRVRLARVATVPEPVQHLLTVMAHDGGVAAAWADPSGGAVVAEVGDVADLVRRLLAVDGEQVAA